MESQWQVNDSVACWFKDANDDQFNGYYEARILDVKDDGNVYKVQYLDDNTVDSVSSSWVKEKGSVDLMPISASALTSASGAEKPKKAAQKFKCVLCRKTMKSERAIEYHQQKYVCITSLEKEIGKINENVWELVWPSNFGKNLFLTDAMWQDFEECGYGEHIGLEDLMKRPAKYVDMQGVCLALRVDVG
jgi:hypothetical protein